MAEVSSPEPNDMSGHAVQLKDVEAAMARRDLERADKLLALLRPAPGQFSEILYRRIDVALARGRVGEALARCDAAVGAQPDNHRFFLKKATILQAMHRHHDAYAALNSAWGIASKDFGVRLALAAAAETRGQPALADELHAGILVASRWHPATLLARMDNALSRRLPGARIRAMSRETESILKEALCEVPDRRADIRQALGDLAFRMTNWAEALSCWQMSGDQEPPRRVLQMAQCHMQRLDEKSARRSIDLALATGAQLVPALLLLSEIELSLGNMGAYFDLQERLLALEGLHRAPVAARMALDLLLQGRSADADAVQARCAAFADERLEIGYAKLLLHRGHAAEAFEYVSAWPDCAEQSVDMAKLFFMVRQAAEQNGGYNRPTWENVMSSQATASTLTSDQILDLYTGAIPPSADTLIGRPNLRLAWQVSGRLKDRKDKSSETWRQAAVRAGAANHFLATGERVSRDDLMPLVTEPDLDELVPYLKDGKPVLVATMHQGPLLASPLTHFLPNILSVTMDHKFWQDEDPGYGNISLDIGRGRAAIEVVKGMREGKVLMIAADTDVVSVKSGGSLSGANGCIFGVPVCIPDTIPRLAREFDAPSFWLRTSWQNGKICFHFTRLPDPEAGEDSQAWYDRWAAAFLGHVEGAMRAEPENLNINAPFWRYLLVNGVMDILAS